MCVCIMRTPVRITSVEKFAYINLTANTLMDAKCANPKVFETELDILYKYHAVCVINFGILMKMCTYTKIQRKNIVYLDHFFDSTENIVIV